MTPATIDALPLGDGAIRFAIPSGVDAVALLESLHAVDGVRDVVVTEHDACVLFDEDPPDLEAAIGRARARGATAPVASHTIRVVYDGEDLDAIARATGLEREAIIAAHTGTIYTVRCVGFMPGFAYLGDLPEPLRLPRRPRPRERVPANSVAIAGTRTGIYPFASPGGWHLVGVAHDFVPFDPIRGATLRLGDHVRFEAVT